MWRRSRVVLHSGMVNRNVLGRGLIQSSQYCGQTWLSCEGNVRSTKAPHFGFGTKSRLIWTLDTTQWVVSASVVVICQRVVSSRSHYKYYFPAAFQPSHQQHLPTAVFCTHKHPPHPRGIHTRLDVPRCVGIPRIGLQRIRLRILSVMPADRDCVLTDRRSSIWLTATSL